MVFLAPLRETFAPLRETSAPLCETFAPLRGTFAPLRETLAPLRGTYLILFIENRPEGIDQCFSPEVSGNDLSRFIQEKITGDAINLVSKRGRI